MRGLAKQTCVHFYSFRLERIPELDDLCVCVCVFAHLCMLSGFPAPSLWLRANESCMCQCTRVCVRFEYVFCAHTSMRHCCVCVSVCLKLTAEWCRTKSDAKPRPACRYVCAHVTCRVLYVQCVLCACLCCVCSYVCVNLERSEVK